MGLVLLVMCGIIVIRFPIREWFGGVGMLLDDEYLQDVKGRWVRLILEKQARMQSLLAEHDNLMKEVLALQGRIQQLDDLVNSQFKAKSMDEARGK